MPGLHAYLSPSGANRWLNCTPSIKLEEQFPKERSSAFAEEGTKAHTIAEQKLTKWVNRKRNKIVCEDKDMDAYTDQYRDYVIEVYNGVKKTCKDPVLLIEQKLDLSEWTVNGFGTGDAIIIGDDTLHIIDLKYGKGVPVSAIDNPQLRLYALGAVKEFMALYDFVNVDMHIFQPRLDNISDEIMSVTDLIAWGDQVVKPAAALAYKGEGQYNPSEDTCRWCRARSACKARADMYERLKNYGFSDPDLLSNQEIADILGYISGLMNWADDVKLFALNQMLNGAHIEGFKVVEGRSKRTISDADQLIENMKNAGIKEELLFEKRLLTLTNLEKLTGKKEFQVLSADCVTKPAGAPTIAPVSDKRPEYNLGANDFAEELKTVSS